MSDAPSFGSLNNLKMYAMKCMRTMTIHGVEPVSVTLKIRLCGIPLVVECHRSGIVTVS